MEKKKSTAGHNAYQLASRIFPIHRCLMGEKVKETLEILSSHMSKESDLNMTVHSIPTGTQVFDWIIPREWVLREAYIENEAGERIIDVKENNLFVVGYSTAVDRWVERDELLKYICIQEDQPDVIPYVTSYYKERYGFCMEKNRRDHLPDGRYHMVIDSELIEGYLTYGEVVIPGKKSQEILFSTYICHPSMANDNCSGMALQTELINYVESIQNRKYTYRFLFVPETIGSIAYISQHLDYMKQHIVAGFNLSCVGDNKYYSLVHTREADSLVDRVMSHLFDFTEGKCVEYSFAERGSDERQYNSPRVALPVVNFSRSIFHDFPEYHTSADNMTFISEEGLQGSYDMMRRAITLLEHNERYVTKVFCEPQLGKRGLYPTLSHKNNQMGKSPIVQLLGYADGKRDLIDIANAVGMAADELIESLEILKEANLIEEA